VTVFVMGHHRLLSVKGIGFKDGNTIVCSIDPICLGKNFANRVRNDNEMFVFLFIDPILT
jgi:hypothetical protein